MIAFSFAMIWIGVLLGEPRRRRPRRVQGVAFVAIFPLTFIASTFVPTSTLPDGAADVRRVEPASSLANALRHLFGNPGGRPRRRRRRGRCSTRSPTR